MSKWRCLEAGCDTKWRHVSNMKEAVAAYETHRKRRHPTQKRDESEQKEGK